MKDYMHCTKISSNPQRDNLRTKENISTPFTSGSFTLCSYSSVTPHHPTKGAPAMLPPAVDVVSWTTFFSTAPLCSSVSLSTRHTAEAKHLLFTITPLNFPGEKEECSFTFQTSPLSPEAKPCSFQDKYGSSIVELKPKTDVSSLYGMG